MSNHTPIKFLTIREHIERTIGGKFLPQHYDWQKDPKHYKLVTGHRPFNRCYRCGSRFVGGNQDFTVFCNICYDAMKIGGEEDLVNYDAKIFSSRIRIPDESPKKEKIDPNSLEDHFKRAKDLV